MPRIKCSTPYGIKGLDTIGRVTLSFALPVLNALRHQRFGHPAPTSPCSAISTRAQRLTASKVWTHLQMRIRDLEAEVLNALRHQRFGHSNPALLSGFPLCAQRLTASKVWTHTPTDLSPGEWQCSTPYGIKGLDTYKANNRSAFGFVLNALRHQRFGHRSGGNHGFI